MMLFFFVDDICIIYEARHVQHVEEFQAKLFKRYEMRYLGEIAWFLGFRITRNREAHTLSLCQDSYIDKIMKRFHIDLSGKAPKNPLISSETLVKNAGTAEPQDTLLYQQLVGSLNFAATGTRADIGYAASKLSEFLTNPSKRHLEAANRAMQYLGHHRLYCIVYDAHAMDPSLAFLASSDASFADDLANRFSYP